MPGKLTEAMEDSARLVNKSSASSNRTIIFVGLMLGSILAGMAQGFWWLVGARAVQDLGMGALQTLSQTIIGDIISPEAITVMLRDEQGSGARRSARTRPSWRVSTASPP